MDYSNLENTTVNNEFFAPLEQVYHLSEKRYDCRSISDLKYAKLGIQRCVSKATTGNEFIQDHGQETAEFYDVSHFFKALKSNRRLSNIQSLNNLLRNITKESIPDAFAHCRELDGFDIYAGDGHYHHAASFDPKKDGKKRATGHFFRVDLRNHHLDYIALEKPDKWKKKKHDARIIQEADPEALRNNAPIGRKVIYCWDKACVDYRQWRKLKFNNGIYFITLEKSNSAAEKMSNNQHDKSDPRNHGIQADYLVGVAGQMMRRVIYEDPRDGKIHTYITNELTLPAFALALIYKHRWDEEKIFYQLKSKFNERKSWASSDEAKQAHAIFECLTHNLSLLIEHRIIKEEKIVDEVEAKKNEGREKHRTNRDGDTMKAASNYIGTAIQRATHRTQRFIRWLRKQLYTKLPWNESMHLLRMVWLKNPT